MAKKAKKNLQEELLKRKSFTIPSIQKELGVGYKELRNCVREMENNGQAFLSNDGLTYNVKDIRSASVPSENDNSAFARYSLSKQSPVKSPYEYDDDDEYDEEDDDDEADELVTFDEIMATRRRELLERLAKSSETNGESKKVSEGTAEEVERLKEYAFESGDCKLIQGINYADEKATAQKIIDRLDRVGYKLTLKAIQYGMMSIGYVFDYPQQKKDPKEINLYAYGIKSVTNATDVKVVAPWGNGTVYILVKHDGTFDPLCKKVLKYWIMRNGGCASVASVQHGLGIGFNRACRIMDSLQEFGCVERKSPGDKNSESERVKLTLQEVNILFPRALGWD